MAIPQDLIKQPAISTTNLQFRSKCLY